MPAEKGIFLDILPRFDMVALDLILNKIMAGFKKTGAAVGASFGDEAQAKILALAEAERKASNIREDATNRAIKSIHAEEIADRELTLAREKLTVARMRDLAVQNNENAAAATKLASTNRLTAAEIAYERARHASTDASLMATARLRDEAKATELAAKASEAHSSAVAASAVSVNNMGKALNVAGVAATGTFLFAMLESGKAAGNFQERLTRLVASAGETTGNLKTVSDGLMNVASQTGYSANELADGMYLVEKAGYRGANGITVMRAAAQLARAENTSLDEVIQGLTTTMHDFHIPTDQAAAVASKMNVAVGEAKTNLRDFSSALSSVEPTASIAKMRLEEVYAALAQITQSGISAERAGQNLNNMLEHLVNIPSTQRTAMNKFGIDPDEVKKGLGDPNVGLIGIMDAVQRKIKDHLTPEGQVWVDTYFKSASAVRTVKNELEAIKNNPAVSDTGKKLAEDLEAGRIGVKEFTMARRDEVNASTASMLKQFQAAYERSQGFSANLNKLQSQEETVAQAYKEIFGTDAAFRVAAQIAGSEEALNDYAKKVLDLKLTTAEADGTVKGFNVTQETLNARLRDAKASFGNVAIQLGNAFLPVLTGVANALGWVARGLEAHPNLMLAITLAIGAMSAAWLTWKGIVIGSAIIEAISGMIGWFSKLQASVMLTIAEMQGIVPAAAEGAAAVTTAAATESGAIATVGTTAVVSSGEIVGMGEAAVVAEGEVGAAAAGMNAALGTVGTTAVTVGGMIARVGAAAAGLAAAAGIGYLVSKGLEHGSVDDPNSHNRRKFRIAVPDTGHAADEADKSQENADQQALDQAKGKLEQEQALADLRNKMMPVDPFTKAETYAILQMGLGGKSEDEAIKLGREKFGTAPNLTPTLDQQTLAPPDPNAFNGGSASGGKKGKNGKDLPGGTKEDPVYTMPMPQNGLGPGKGDGTTDNIGFSYDPFKEAGQGNWTLPNVARLMATFFANMALGNPYGRLHPGKAGESASNPLYVQQVGGTINADGTMTITKSQLKMMNLVAAENAAETKYNDAISKYGQGSPEAMKAWLNVMNKKAAIKNLEAQADKYGWDLGGSESEDDSLHGMDPADALTADTGGDDGSGNPNFHGLLGGRGRGRPGGGGGRMAQGAGGAERWRGAVRMALLKYGPGLNITNGKAWEDALVRQIATESMGDPRADNPGDSNGRGGTQHVSGLLQFLPSTFAAHNISGGNYMDPHAQIAAALDYVKSRYGVDQNGAPLWIGRGVGYDTGGELPPGPTLVQNDTGKPELVLNPEQREALGLEPGGSGPTPVIDPNTTQHGTGQGANPGPDKDGSAQVTGGTGKGFGIQGGILGSAMSAASAAGSMALNSMAPGAGMAADIMTQEANRAVGYIGQLAGIAAGGLLETFMLNDSPLADPGKSLLGKVAFGIAGGHPSKPNSAGAYAPPLKQNGGTEQQVSPYGDLTITNNFHGTNDNADQVTREQNRGLMMYGGTK